MPVQVKTQLDVVALQAKAQELLTQHHISPQRYGTAFHLTPPFQDVREIPVPDLTAAPMDFGNLSDSDRNHIFTTLDNADPYLLWYVANIDHLPARVLKVEEGQSMVLKLHGPELLFVFLQKNAHLSIENIISNQALGLGFVFVWQEAGSHFSFWGLRTGNNFLHESVKVYLQGHGASADIRHLTYGEAKEQSDISVNVYHQAPKTTSNLLVRTAAIQKHVAMYRGLIDMDVNSKGARGYQQGKALLLSRGAVVDNLPELAIRTNDVQCSHGVNTTHVDDAALFYMRSRGVSEKEARQLAIIGFYYDMLEIPQFITKALDSTLDKVPV